MSDPAPSRPPVPIIIDTDGGIDDAVALWWACASPLVELVGATIVFGNVDVDVAARNVCRVLEAAGRDDVPVAVGEAEPVGNAPPLRRADFIHGADGVGDTGRLPVDARPTDESAADLLLRVVRARPGEVVVVTLGPMSNIATVIAADAGWSAAVARLVVMGGTMTSPGNAMPAGEANIAHDPVAAATSFGAPWAQPPLLVTLDVTHTATLTDAHIALAREHRSDAATDLADLLAFYQTFGGTFCPPGEFPCHDALATMAAAMPGLVSGPVLPLAVETNGGPAWGMTVADRRQPFFVASGQHQSLPDGFAPCEVGTDVDVAQFRAEVERLLGAHRPA